MTGISIRPTIGVGDGLQFSSLPENYFRATGKKLIDVTKPWFFDHNPFVDRDSKPTKIQELWNFGPGQYEWPKVRELGVYLSNAEIWAALYKVPVMLNRPRLYAYENLPFERRDLILLHTAGISHGEMPLPVLEHVVKKYGPSGRLFQLLCPRSKDIGLPKIAVNSLWDVAEIVSGVRMLIGVDSGPAWISTCYPDVITKVVRTKPSPDALKDWVPLEKRNIHSHWDDRARMIFNTTDNDIGFTWSYRKL